MFQGVYKIYHSINSLIIQTEMSKHRMFKLLAHIPIPTKNQPRKCFRTISRDLLYLWHRRYDHMNHKGLEILQQKGMVHGFPQLWTSNITCTYCIQGKQHHNNMPIKITWRESHYLELIHANICGSIWPISNSGKRYILYFIDDFSHKT